MANDKGRLDSLFHPDKRLIFVGGKGGVGKSSISSAIALHLSRQCNTLLISTDPAHSTADSLGTTRLDGLTTVKMGSSDLNVWELDSAKAFSEFKDKHEQEIRLLFDTSTYMDEEDIDQVMSLMIPGIDEVMALKSIFDIMSEERYEKIIVDTAPTGHALRLLFMPDILNHWVKVMAGMRWKYKTIQKTFKGKYTPDDADDMLLDLKRMVSRMKNTLVDHQGCEFVLVTQPGTMIINETKRLYEKLQSNGVGVHALVVNCLAPDSSDSFYSQLHVNQQALLKGIQDDFEGLEMIKMPLFPFEITGLDGLNEFEKALFTKTKTDTI
ncbi:MAG: ArsA family ATPase [Cyclobacteriaceae bacterium]